MLLTNYFIRNLHYYFAVAHLLLAILHLLFNICTADQPSVCIFLIL